MPRAKLDTEVSVGRDTKAAEDTTDMVGRGKAGQGRALQGRPGLGWVGLVDLS